MTLSEKVCKCSSTDAEERACIQQVGALADSNSSGAEPEGDVSTAEVCQEILDAKTCTCAALDAGRFDLCGLADSRNFPPLEP